MRRMPAPDPGIVSYRRDNVSRGTSEEMDA
jgi:hypothetical protein